MKDIEIGKYYLMQDCEGYKHVVYVEDKDYRYVNVVFLQSPKNRGGGYFPYRLLKKLDKSELLLEMMD